MVICFSGFVTQNFICNAKMFCYDYRNLEDEATAFDNKSSSTIKLNNGTVLYLREVNRCLALVCILREESFDKQGRVNDCPNY